MTQRKKPRSRINVPRRTFRPGQTAVAGISGTLIAVLSASATCAGGPFAPAAAGGGSFTPVILASTGEALQPVIDAIVDQTQQAVQDDSELPYATEDANASLPTLLQNTNFELLQVLLGTAANESHFGITFTTPEQIATDAANPREYLGFFNADTFYPEVVDIDPDATYQLSGTVGKGTGDLSMTTSASSFGSADPIDSLELDHGLNVHSDGSFTVDIGPTEPSDSENYLDSSGASLLTLRDRLSDLGLGGSSLNFECVEDCPKADPGVTSTGLSNDTIYSLLQTIKEGGPTFYDFNIEEEADKAGIQLPDNTMSHFEGEKVQGGFPGQALAVGNFHLQSDEALIVKVPEVDAGYGSVQLNNVFGATLPGTLAQTTLNDTQAFHDSDGYTYYVVSGTNPGVANWLDTGGASAGDVMARYQNLTEDDDPTGQSVTTEVVSIDDVRDHLPDDTPTVTPEEYAATMNERVLSLDYALDISRNSAWSTQQLWLNDLEDAMGAKNFHEVFGEEPATPMWLRLTPALSPDMGTVAKDLFSNPSDSLSALEDNLSLAAKDIELPVKLAGQLFQHDFTQITEAIEAIASGDNPQEAMTTLGSDVQQLATTFNEVFFDPNTSITAGILNARDDLATAIMAATKDGFPTEQGPLATWEWDHISELADPSSNDVFAETGDVTSLLSALGL
jgi:hypothetical protein